MSALTPTSLPSLQLKSILVATDFSPASDQPLLQAISIARHYGAKLYVVHIVSSLGFVLAGAGVLGLATEAAWRDMEQLEEELSHMGMLKGLDSHFFVTDGRVCEELEDIVQREHIDLVVVGTHRRKGVGRLLIGSVAEQIFRYSSCPVVTIGPHSEIMCEEKARSDRSLLFVTDFGSASLKTLPHAISLANRLRKHLILLHVLSPVPEPGNRWFRAGDVDQIKERAKVATVQRLAKLVSGNIAVEEQPAFMVGFDEPAKGILQTAEALQTEMIIMGLTKRTYVETISHLLWATANEVVCGAACPVLIMKY
jgi:nucleotide-binding universal stress UspA family protein